MKKLSALLGMAVLSVASLHASGYVKSPAKDTQAAPASTTDLSVIDPYQRGSGTSSCLSLSVGYWFGELAPSNRVIATQAPATRQANLARESVVTYPVNLASGIAVMMTFATENDQRILFDYQYFAKNSARGGVSSTAETSNMVSTWPIANAVTGETGSVYQTHGQYNVYYNHEMMLHHVRELMVSKNGHTSFFAHYGVSGTFRLLGLTTDYSSAGLEGVDNAYSYKQYEKRSSGGVTVGLNLVNRFTKTFGMYGSLTSNGEVGTFTTASQELFQAGTTGTVLSGLNQGSHKIRFFQDLQARVGAVLEYASPEGDNYGIDLSGTVGVEPDATALGVPQTSSTATTMLSLFRCSGRLSLFAKF